MDRPIIYPQEQARNFDIMGGWVDNQIGLGYQFEDVVNATGPLIGGFAITYNSSLTLTFGAGRYYSQQPVDASTYGAQPANTTQVWVQAIAPQQNITFSVGAIGAGQSQWALVEVAYVQQNIIPSNDPTSGVLTYYNPADPTQPYTGSGNSGTPQSTVRNDLASVVVKYGTAATTGSETPPTVDAGYSPMYLVHLTNGQTSITSADVFVAGPTATPNPPSYIAPFISTLLSSQYTIFTANGTFTPLVTGTYAIKALGGGGGGGAGGGSTSASNAGAGGMGGSGGQLGFSTQSLTAGTSYAVVIGTGGSGGAGATGLGSNGSPGNPTTFNAITIAAGGSGGSRGSTNNCVSLVSTPGSNGGGNEGGAGGQISSTTGNPGTSANANTGGGGGGGGGGGAGASVAGGSGGNGGSGLLVIWRVA